MWRSVLGVAASKETGVEVGFVWICHGLRGSGFD